VEVVATVEVAVSTVREVAVAPALEVGMAAAKVAMAAQSLRMQQVRWRRMDRMHL